MKNVYSKKERERIKLYKRLATIGISLIILLSVSIIASNYFSPSSNSIYTPEQLAHDHDGDGIPDH